MSESPIKICELCGEEFRQTEKCKIRRYKKMCVCQECEAEAEDSDYEKNFGCEDPDVVEYMRRQKFVGIVTLNGKYEY